MSKGTRICHFSSVGWQQPPASCPTGLSSDGPHAASTFDALDADDTLAMVVQASPILKLHGGFLVEGLRHPDVQAMTAPVHAERIRHYHRLLADQRSWLSFREVALLFGYKTLAACNQAAALLTASVLRHTQPDCPSTVWWNQASQPQRFRLEICARAMRQACVVLASLQHSGAPKETHTQLVFALRHADT